ncbi:MAG: hypothetical protein JRI23_16130 [Deltaproteobacteria bacterium]|jgi:hypothetical protein|nr:hypothetical protein [Deltaproteobacteria bacterium]MBW2533299.1 hypothetical protein [Deltaproteobacteria bacterium]
MKLGPVRSVWIASLLLGCANTPPSLEPLSDQTAYVDRELSLSLAATDADGDALTFSFASESPSIDSRASLVETGSNRRLFQWTPLSVDVGERQFDFRVSDGIDEAEATISVAVVPSGDGATGPVFVQPLGTGAQIDLAATPCIDLPVVVTDEDSASVIIAAEAPLIAGSSLVQTTELSATWSWCPSPQQIADANRYSLTLSADDSQNPRTLKNFLLVLEGSGDLPSEPPPGGSCVDDGFEDDDESGQARTVDLAYGPHSSLGNAICSGDEDWFAVHLFAGDTVHASLTFDQHDARQDLDLQLFRGAQRLVGCDEATPAYCDPNNGQSGSSNERLVWSVTDTDLYYVVVRGWDGSQNEYDICIDSGSGACP